MPPEPPAAGPPEPPVAGQPGPPAVGGAAAGDLTAALAALPLRDNLRGSVPYGAPQLAVPVQLNTNENPYPPSPALVAAIAAAVAGVAAGLNRYPDREALGLRGGLARYLSAATGVPVDAGQVWAANGSNEVLQQLLQAFGGPGRVALGFGPSYTMHRLISRGTGTGWVECPRDPADFGIDVAAALAAIAAHRPAVVFVCSPNNPTGTACPPDALLALLAAAPGMVVVDEAYGEFSTSGSALRWLADHPRLVVTRTMSKAFAFAGCRLGYLAASPAVVAALQLVRLPYHLSALTQAAAGAALAHTDELLGGVAALRAERERLVGLLRAQDRPVVDSDANFVLVRGFADSHRAWQQLLDRGVLVRDVGIPGALRVTVGTPTDTDALLTALEGVR